MDKIAAADIARYLYEDMQRMSSLTGFPFGLKKGFDNLPKSEKSIWEQYASGLEEKLQSSGLLIRPYKDFCRTCIITEREIESLVASDNSVFSLTIENGQQILGKTPSGIKISEIPEEEKRFFRELNYLIPLQIKRMGYEIIRPEEASDRSQYDTKTCKGYPFEVSEKDEGDQICKLWGESR